MGKKKNNMTERRRALGKGLGALIPQDDDLQTRAATRPVDAFFPQGPAANVSRETTESDEELVEVPGATFAHVPVSDIAPNRAQPRQVFDEDELAELTASVQEVGILQPVVVRPMPDPGDGDPAYELIMGERRWR